MKHKRSTQIEELPPPPANVPAWRPLLRVGFRFVFVYVVLFSLATQIAGSLFQIPTSAFRGFGTIWPMRLITFWIAAHVFGVNGPLLYGRNTGETLFYWIQTFWLIVLSGVATAVWSVIDRRRLNYVRLHAWLRLFVRLALAASMFEYAMTKVIPTQFPRPSLNTLVTPVGDLSLSALLWATIGASPGYEIFTGCAELLGGILLLVPRTTTLGAMICLADMAQVFVLNMTYDIGLKQISFHMVLLSIFLLAPELRRLADFFVFNRLVGPSPQVEFFHSRFAVIAQLAVGVYLLGTYAYINWTYWYAAGDRSPRSALYGIWNVDELRVDGESRPPTLNDYDRRWRRLIFDLPNAMAVQRLDDSFARYGASVDIYRHSIVLTKGGSRNWKANFDFQQPGPNRLILDGEIDGHKIHAQLQLADFDTFRLLNSRFRWVRPED
jgi:hypothetical protein